MDILLVKELCFQYLQGLANWTVELVDIDTSFCMNLQIPSIPGTLIYLMAVQRQNQAVLRIEA